MRLRAASDMGGGIHQAGDAPLVVHMQKHCLVGHRETLQIVSWSRGEAGQAGREGPLDRANGTADGLLQPAVLQCAGAASPRVSIG